MSEPKERPTRSTVHVRRHPVHPTLVVFPIAFLTATPAADAVFLWTGDIFWAEAASWLVRGGLAMGLMAALVGTIDFVTMPAVRRHVSAWSHFLAGTFVLALAGANVPLRWDDPAAAVWPLGLLLSVTMAGAVAVTGWLGGTLTFKHGIGTYGNDPVAGEGEDTPPRPGYRSPDAEEHARLRGRERGDSQ